MVKIYDEDAFDEYEYIELDKPRVSPDSGLTYTHMAVPKKEEE